MRAETAAGIKKQIEAGGPGGVGGGCWLLGRQATGPPPHAADRQSAGDNPGKHGVSLTLTIYYNIVHEVHDSKNNKNGK